MFEQKIYCDATIEDDFDNSSVIVGLDKNLGGINKQHKDSFFGNFEKEYIEDLSTVTGDVKSKRIDEKNFRQILKIKLPINNKENVLNIIKKLEKIEGIKYAQPSYIYQAGTVPEAGMYEEQWGIDGTTGIIGINAREAWDITTGGRNVRVGILESGIAPHPDLNSNLVAGVDFTKSGNTNDSYGHGTHVAVDWERPGSPLVLVFEKN